VKRAFSTFKQVPIRFYRDNVIAYEGDAAEYIFFVVRGVVRSCRYSKVGVRNIVAFYLPGDFLGWTGLRHSLSIEAATDAEVSQTEHVIVARVTGKSGCLFFAAGDDR
jgi:CRP-like cAMP-binding protein